MEQAFWYVIDNGIALDSRYKVSNITEKCHYLGS